MSVQEYPLEVPTRIIQKITGSIHETRNKEMGSEKTIRKPERDPPQKDKNAERRRTSHQHKEI